MSQNPISPAPTSLRRRSVVAPLVATAALVTLLLGSAGCEELDARRSIQEAGRLYSQGNYLEAAKKYEQALKVMPNHPIPLHNLALTYHKLFRPGDPDERNMGYARKATEYFQRYLETDPDNQTIIRMMTGVWMDSSQYDAAISFWENKLQADPNNKEIIQTVANIYRQADKFETSVEWYRRLAKVEETKNGKAQAYLNIGVSSLNRLIYEKDSLFHDERLKVADIGIGALQAARTFTPESSEIENYLGALYQRRSTAHGSSWAWLTDVTTAQYYSKRYIKFRNAEKAAAEKQKPENEDPAKPSGGS